jgi:hypothetical protein
VVRITFTKTTQLVVGDEQKKPDPYHAGRSYSFPASTAEYWIARGVAVLASEAKGVKTDAERGLVPSRAGTAPPAGPPPTAAMSGDVSDEDLATYTVPKLTAYAAEHEIDLGKATRKEDMLQVILNARALKAQV